MKKVLCIAGACLSLAACGMVEMPHKMDKSNQNMEEMAKKMDETNRKMEIMVGGIEAQKQLIPFEAMLKAENVENLSPIPSRLMPYGEKLAQAIPADDMVKLAYLWLKEVDEVFPAHKVDANGDEIPYNKTEIAKINQDKLAHVVGLQIVAGFLPQSVINEMIEKQVYLSGRYEDTVYAILMLRTQFIRDVLLDASLLSAPLNNAGKVAQAVEYNKAIDSIAKLGFTNKIGLKTRGFIPEENSPVEKFDSGIALKNWERIQRSAERDCDLVGRGVEAKSGNPVRDQELHQAQLNVYNQALAEIKGFIDSWPRP